MQFIYVSLIIDMWWAYSHSHHVWLLQAYGCCRHASHHAV